MQIYKHYNLIRLKNYFDQMLDFKVHLFTHRNYSSVYMLKCIILTYLLTTLPFIDCAHYRLLLVTS